MCHHDESGTLCGSALSYTNAVNVERLFERVANQNQEIDELRSAIERMRSTVDRPPPTPPEHLETIVASPIQ